MQTAWLQEQKEQVSYSAVTFRHLLDSLSRPGKIIQLSYPDFWGEPPSHPFNATPLNLYALGAIWTLLDSEVNFVVAANGQWLNPTNSVVQWLALRSGSQVVAPETAAFAFFCDGKSGGLDKLNAGTLLEPELSTTAIYCVKNLSSETGINSSETISLELSGPGIQNKALLQVRGLDKGEIEQIRATRQQYPLGIDVYLIDTAGRCVGLPRTTKIRVLSNED